MRRREDQGGGNDLALAQRQRSGDQRDSEQGSDDGKVAKLRRGEVTAKRQRTDPGTETTDAKRPRLWIHNNDQGRVTTMLGEPEMVSSVIGLRWPRMEAAS